MENEKFLKLTSAVYKVLDFFPESDPLKNRAKDKALSISERLTLINQASGWMSFQKEKVKAEVLEDIDVLLGYLWIGKAQGWLNSASCIIISYQYENLKKELGAPIAPVVAFEKPVEQELEKEEIIPEPKPAKPVKKKEMDFKMSDRQKTIMEFLSKNSKAQVMELQTVLGNVTKRTIRRDLDELLQMDRIVRMGDFNQIFYKAK